VAKVKAVFNSKYFQDVFFTFFRYRCFKTGRNILWYNLVDNLPFGGVLFILPSLDV